MRPPLREIDKPLVAVTVALAAYGLAALYSAGRFQVRFASGVWRNRRCCGLFARAGHRRQHPAELLQTLVCIFIATISHARLDAFTVGVLIGMVRRFEVSLEAEQPWR